MDLNKIETHALELAEQIGICNEGFKAMPLKDKILGIGCFAHMLGDIRMKNACKEMLAVL